MHKSMLPPISYNIARQRIHIKVLTVWDESARGEAGVSILPVVQRRASIHLGLHDQPAGALGLE